MASGWALKSFDRARWDAIFGSGDPEAARKIVDAMLWDEPGYFDPDSDDPRPGYGRDQILSSYEGRATLELASHLVSKGFTYEGLGEAMSVKLDEFGCLMWSPEGLREALDARQLSDSWLSPRAVTELLFRAGQFQALQYLEGHLPAAIGATEQAVHAFWTAHRREMQRPASHPRTPVRLLRLLDDRSPESGRPSRTLVGLLRRLLALDSPPGPEIGRRFGTEAEPTRGHSCFYVIFSPTELVELRREVEAAIDAAMPWTAPNWLPEDIEQNLLVPLKTIEVGRWASMTWAY